MDYLMGKITKPSTYKYTLRQTGGYPALRGMMTWSINWDAVSTCGAVNEYAKNFEAIYPNYLTSVAESELNTTQFGLYPNPSKEVLHVAIPNIFPNEKIVINNSVGMVVLEKEAISGTETLDISELKNGIYVLKYGQNTQKFIKQ